MDLKSLTRNAGVVKKDLSKLGNGSIMTAKGCSIYIPSRYREKQFATFNRDIYILGIFAIRVGKYYSVNNVIAKMKVLPDLVNEVTIDDDEYTELVFDPGSIVIASTALVKDDKLPYYVYDEFVSKGNVPKFFGYDDLINLFKSTKKHCGVSFASSPTILHMVLTMIARDSKDLNKFFRTIATDTNQDDVAYVSLSSTTHGANNTTARLIGAHFTDNITTALTTTSLVEENYEHNVRL